MKKTFRLSLEIGCTVNEKVSGVGNKKILRCTQGIVNRLLKHPGLLNEFYVNWMMEYFLAEEVIESMEEQYDVIEKNNDFWKKIKTILPDGLLSYYEKELCGENEETNSEGDYIKDLNWSLLFEQLNKMEVIRVTVEELKSSVNKDVVEAVNLLVIDLASGVAKNLL